MFKYINILGGDGKKVTNKNEWIGLTPKGFKLRITCNANSYAVKMSRVGIGHMWVKLQIRRPGSFSYKQVQNLSKHVWYLIAENTYLQFHYHVIQDVGVLPYNVLFFSSCILQKWIVILKSEVLNSMATFKLWNGWHSKGLELFATLESNNLPTSLMEYNI